MTATGWLLVHGASRFWSPTAEDGVDRFLAAHRDRLGNDVSNVLSVGADTVCASLFTLLAVVVAWRWGSSPRQPLLIAFAVLLELTTFLLTTVLVHRARPAVPHLDASPPTSSFPSGHTAAAVALYGAVAVLLYETTRRRAWWCLLVVPAAVGAARLYRGMHHPSDVAAGALLGALAVAAAHRAVSPRSPRTHTRAPVERGAAVLIVNGGKVNEDGAAALHERFEQVCAEVGLTRPRLSRTTKPGQAAAFARDALAARAPLIVACGGDGTVSEVAGVLAGSTTVLGIVPLGTGNLLARALGIPQETPEALAVLVRGVDRRIDAGLLDGRVFLGMAGLGLDAAMIEAAPDRLKRRAGWAAYAVAAVRHLADRIAVLDLEVDGRRSRHRGVSTLLVGNIGRLQAGLRPMPDAAVDDGRLDLVVLAPRGRLGWLRAAAGMWRADLLRDGEQIASERGRRVVVRTRRPVAREADGETLPPAAGMRVEIWPAALTVRVPAAAAERAS